MVKKIMCFGRDDVDQLRDLVRQLQDAGIGASYSEDFDRVTVRDGHGTVDFIYYDDLKEVPTESFKQFAKAKTRLAKLVGKYKGLINDEH